MMIQEILTISVFVIAVGYLITKFIWKPSFMRKKKKSNSCGTSDCGCH